MMRLVVVLACIILAPLTTADLLQPQADARHTGALDTHGPRYDDLAWSAQLAGSAAAEGAVLIIDGHAYVGTQDYGAVPDSQDAMWRLDLDTGDVNHLFDMTGTENLLDLHAWTSDGAYIFTGERGIIRSHDLEGNEIDAWRLPPRTPEPSVLGWVCNPPVVEDALLVMSCTEIQGTQEGDLFSVQGLAGFVVALDVGPDGSLQERWLTFASATWRTQDSAVPSQLHGPTSGAVCTEPSGCPPQHAFIFGATLTDSAVVSPMAFALPPDSMLPRDTTFEQLRTGEAILGDGHVAVLDRETGELMGVRSAEPPDADSSDPDGISSKPYDQLMTIVIPSRGDAFYAELPWVMELSATNLEEPVWQDATYGAGARRTTALGSHMVLADGYLYNVGGQEIDRYPLDAGEALVDPTIVGPRLDGQEFYKLPHPLLAGGMLYVTTLDLQPNVSQFARFHADGSHVRAFDLETGQGWRIAFGAAMSPSGGQLIYGVDDGVLVAADIEGTVRVIGRTAASPTTAAAVSTVRPDVGERVRVDLSDSTPGRFGPITQYRVDWGDGTVTPWQDGPVFEHAYEENGTFEARLQSGNANQSASAIQEFTVGAGPLPQSNWLSEQFLPEHQERTFFVLGLVITLLGSLLAALRLRRKRGIMARELAAIDKGPGDERSLEDFLQQCEGRASGHLHAGRITEAQYQVLRDHIATAGRTRRMRALGDDLGDLPHGLVGGLSEILADGRISSAERSRAHALVDAADLPPTKKRDAHRRIDGWLAGHRST